MIIYTKNNCVQCKFVKRWLDNEGIDYTEINTDTHPEELARLKLQGFRQLPVTEHNGNTVSGFNVNGLKGLL